MVTIMFPDVRKIVGICPIFEKKNKHNTKNMARSESYYIPSMYCIYGVASKFGYGSARGDPDVWNGLDHLRFGMDRGYGWSCGFRVWIGALYFDSQPCSVV